MRRPLAWYGSTVSIPRIAVITTRNRPGELARLCEQLNDAGADAVVAVDNNSEPPVTCDWLWGAGIGGFDTYVESYPDDPPNLYRMWNLGFTAALAYAREHEADEWDVGVFNDDATLPPGWFDTVVHALRSTGAVAASSDPYGTRTSVELSTSPGGGVVQRMCPWAFVVRGEANIRADEDFGWWWGDTDLEWRCRQSGGVVIVPGLVCGNTLANSTTVGVLAEQAGRDGETFARKWGYRPW